MAFFSISFTLLIMASYPCLSVFTTGTSKLPRITEGFAVAYDSSTNTILLFGGDPISTQFVTFKDHTFTDEGEEYLTSEQSSYGWSQHYIQLGDELWMIQTNYHIEDLKGAAFIKVNTKTYAITVDSASFPVTVSDSGCLAGNDAYLFVIGGGDGYGSNAMKTTQIYRISDGEWLQNVPSLNTERMSFSCMVYDNTLYVIGGDDGSTYLDSIETLDISNMDTISTKAWATDLVQPLKSGRKGPHSVIYGTDIYVIGGKDNNGERVTDINVIDTLTGSVSYGDTLDYATSYAASIIVGNTLYVFAGYRSSELDTYQYSILPTLSTKDPSAAPISISPSDDPTLRPTNNPTNTPTLPPSYAPTSFPSNVLHPSYAPTLFPSNMPTLHPSHAPTSPPSDDPTNTAALPPSYAPTLFPSNVATLHPSDTPTLSPSDTSYNGGSAEVIEHRTTEEIELNDDMKRKKKLSLIVFILVIILSVLFGVILIVFCRYGWYKYVQRKDSVNMVAEMRDHKANEVQDTADIVNAQHISLSTNKENTANIVHAQQIALSFSKRTNEAEDDIEELYDHEGIQRVEGNTCTKQTPLAPETAQSGHQGIQGTND